MSGGPYVLDTNVFIEAHRRYYAFDLVPAFWDTLVRLAEEGEIESIDRVKEELLKGNEDRLVVWVTQDFTHAFRTTDDEAVRVGYGEIIAWATNNVQFLPAAKDEFARLADGWLVAYAYQKGRRIVTHEVMKPEVRNRIPIPNVCHAFGVGFLDTFRMLRELGVKL